MSRRVTALAATAVLAGAGLALPPAPAAADYGTYVNAASVRSFWMGAESAKTFTVSIDAEGASAVDWSIESAHPDCSVVDHGTAGYRGGNTWTDTFTITRSERGDDHACAGAMVLRVYAYGASPDYGYDDASFVTALRRQARIRRTDFGPEPVERGSTVTGSAVLQRISWVDNRWHGDADETASVQFRTMTGRYGDVRSVRSDAAGRLRTSGRQSVDGCWRFVTRGYSTTIGTSPSGDCVDTVRPR